MAKVIKAFKLKPDCHCTSKYLNNLIEQNHRHIKVRKTRYQSINTAKNTGSIINWTDDKIHQSNFYVLNTKMAQSPL